MNNNGRNYPEITIMPQPALRCSNCGFPLTEQQYFCPKCGAAQWGKILCANCGAVLQPGQQFCPRCGHQVGVTVQSYCPSSSIQPKKKKKKKTPGLLIMLLVILALTGIAGVTLGPKIFMDTAGYIEKGDLEKAWDKAKNDEDRRLVFNAYLDAGNYEEAYEKALTIEDKNIVVNAYLDAGNYREAYDKALTTNDKMAIQFENAAAVQSAYTMDNLKNPASFTLRDAYYYESKSEDGNLTFLVLKIGGMNGFGGVVSNYWLYLWNATNKNWLTYCSVYDLEDDEYSKYDDDDELLEKVVDNTGRSYIRDCIKNGTVLSEDGVDRINKLFEQDQLDKVELLDIPWMKSNKG